jgi:hypothetical protein
MDMHVRVDIDAEGALAIKSAAPGGEARLRAEAERLARAVHPGVVALVPPPGGEDGPLTASGELRTRYAGEPVSRWQGSLAAVAGLGSALAATLADLHDLGMVHGRVDGSHVLVGPDGRPRLCGLAPVDGAIPADDVLALGVLLADMVDRAPAGRRWVGWPRSRSGERRALLQVLDRAVDAVPTRRPGARALADDLLRAVPRAELPPPAPPRGSARPDSSAPSASSAASGGPDTFDRLWPFTDADDDEERWAAVFGSGPADRAPATGRLPIAEVETAAWRRDAPADPPPPDPPPPAPDPPPPAPDPLADLVPDRDDLTRERPALADRGGRGARARPAGPAAEPGPARRASRTLVGAAAAAAALLVAGAWTVRARTADAPGTNRAADASTGAAATPPPECPAPVPPAPAADVDGDGCPEGLVVEGGTVTAGPAQFTLGSPGDLVAVGDWDCDGGVSPALLRPATGDVFVFAGWAPEGEPVTVTSSRRVEGGVAIRAEAGAPGCDRLLVDVGAGGSTTVEVPG